jgi:histidyl-tRNA synthetase
VRLKPNRPKARLPRGFVDREAQDIRAVEAMCAKIKQVYELYGFDPVETPLFEYTDALGKFLPDSDRPNEGVFSLQDDDEQWMSLRYDLTAPLARHVAKTSTTSSCPTAPTGRAGCSAMKSRGRGGSASSCSSTPTRSAHPGVQADAEMCMMMADTMEALGMQRGDYVIRVNNRKVLDGVMEAIGVTDDGQKLAVLRAIDKLDKFGPEGVALLLGEGRKDESGDFTKGAGLDAGQTQKVQTVQFGSVAGGGRYDGLVERFTGQTVPATGFSIGVSRLMTALKNLGKLDTQAVQAPVVVCIMDRDADSLGRYQRMVQTLRGAGIRAELFQGNPKQFGKQLQYADRRGSAVAVIQGGDERANDHVTLKDLIAGREAAKDIADRADWVEQRPAQVTVAEADLVAEVRKILAQYEG